jgi:hypothetical protein
MNSFTPKDAYSFMMCHRMGRVPISTIGFGRVFDSSAMRPAAGENDALHARNAGSD